VIFKSFDPLTVHAKDLEIIGKVVLDDPMVEYLPCELSIFSLFCPFAVDVIYTEGSHIIEAATLASQVW
jgi:hypothetical protein